MSGNGICRECQRPFGKHYAGCSLEREPSEVPEQWYLDATDQIRTLRAVVEAARDVLRDGLREDGIRPDTPAEQVSEWLTNGNHHSLRALFDAFYELDKGAM